MALAYLACHVSRCKVARDWKIMKGQGVIVRLQLDTSESGNSHGPSFPRTQGNNKQHRP